MHRAFPDMLHRCLKVYGGTHQQFAKDIGLARASFSHLINGNAGPSVEVCLRIAALTGISAAQNLRAAGKPDIVGLIESLFGAATPTRTATKATYSPDELEVLAKLRQCRPRSRRALRTLIDAAAAANGIDLPDSAKRA